MRHTNKKTSPHRQRRQLFRSLSGQGPVRRPPWTTGDFTDRCVRCRACVDACPEGVLFLGGGGYPELRFADAGCTLCGACVEACDAPVFDTGRPAFPWRAHIEANCLALANVHCQSCQDACDWRAIAFDLQLGHAPTPRVDTAACTGCGACQAQCPHHAITMTTEERAHAD